MIGFRDRQPLTGTNRLGLGKEVRNAACNHILGGGGLTDEDERYLRMISENPKILKFSQDDGFKVWLLKRGHQLLQGTPAHRPLWEVD